MYIRKISHNYELKYQCSSYKLEDDVSNIQGTVRILKCERTIIYAAQIGLSVKEFVVELIT